MNRGRDKSKRIIKKQFWMNEAEDNDLKQKTHRVCLSEAALIRMLIKGYEPREKPGEEFYQYMRQLSVIGNNINQLTIVANKTGNIDMILLKDYYERQLQEIAEVKSLLRQPIVLPEDICP